MIVWRSHIVCEVPNLLAKIDGDADILSCEKLFSDSTLFLLIHSISGKLPCHLISGYLFCYMTVVSLLVINWLRAGVMGDFAVAIVPTLPQKTHR